MSDTEKQLVKVYICKSDQSSVNDWRRTISRGIAEAMASPDGRHVRVMGDAQCGDEAVEIACRAGVYDQGGRVLVCSPYTLLRLLRVSAWYAVTHAQHPDEDYESFRRRLPAPLGLRAFSSSDVGGPNEAVEASIGSLREQMETLDSGYPADEAARIFKATLGIVLAGLFGHETSHIEDGPPFCAITRQSRGEDAGLWQTVLRLQSSNDLFRSISPVAAEVAADRCGARRIRAAVDALPASPLSPASQLFVRRAAADILSTILLTRIDARSDRRVFTINDSYLYPPLRMLALAGEIGLSGPKPTVCGGAAENLVEATQNTLKISPGNEVIPDDMEAVFPGGVIDAWERRSNWSAASFSCD